MIKAEYGRNFPSLRLLDLVDRNAPWESLIDTDRPEVRDAILRLVSAIEPDLLVYSQ